MNDAIFGQLAGGLIVSCQALEGEPLHSPSIMAKMALAAHLGGAVGIRANSVVDIIAIKEEVPLPVIGLLKRDYPNSDIFITPTAREIAELIQGKPDIIALDATQRTRFEGEHLEKLFQAIRENHTLIMADISTIEEALYAESIGADCVSTTLSGYTPYSPQSASPDFKLLQEAAHRLKIPVFAEGRITTPSDAGRMLELGAHAVVVGSAITRPQLITERFAQKVRASSIGVQ